MQISDASDDRVEKLEKVFNPGQKVPARMIGYSLVFDQCSPCMQPLFEFTATVMVGGLRTSHWLVLQPPTPTYIHNRRTVNYASPP